MTPNINSETKQTYEITLSNESWAGVQSLAEKLNLSVSELFEQVGRGQLVVCNAEKIEDLLDTIDGLEALLEAKEEGTVPWEQVKVELGL